MKCSPEDGNPFPSAHEKALNEACEWLEYHQDFAELLVSGDRLDTGESAEYDQSSWFHDHNFFPIDSYPTAEDFEQAAWPNGKRSHRAWTEESEISISPLPVRSTRDGVTVEREMSPLELGLFVEVIGKLKAKKAPEPRIKLQEERSKEEQRKLELLEEKVQAVFKDLEPAHVELLESRYYDCETLEEMASQRSCTYQAVQQQLQAAGKMFKLRWGAGEPLLDARNVASLIGRTPTRVRQLGKAGLNPFIPYAMKPKSLWKRSQTLLMKAWLIHGTMEEATHSSKESGDDVPAA